MTNEQIKQNAEEYAKLDNCKGIDYPQYLAFIAGAHSRDEEIEHYRRIATAYKIDAQDTAAECERLHDIIDKLRNPWISVKDMLPEEHSRVLIMFCNGTVTYNDYIGVGDINYMKAHPEIITHWMPIPKIKKGE